MLLRAILFSMLVWLGQAVAQTPVTVSETVESETYAVTSSTVEDAKSELMRDKPILGRAHGLTTFVITNFNFTMGQPTEGPENLVIPVTSVKIEVSFTVTMPVFTDSVVANCFDAYVEALAGHEDDHILFAKEAVTTHFESVSELVIPVTELRNQQTIGDAKAVINAAFHKEVQAAQRAMQVASDGLDASTGHGSEANPFWPKNDCDEKCFVEFVGGGINESGTVAQFTHFNQGTEHISQLNFEEYQGSLGFSAGVTWAAPPDEPPRAGRFCPGGEASHILIAADGNLAFASELPLCPNRNRPWRIRPSDTSEGERCPDVPSEGFIEASINSEGWLVGRVDGWGQVVSAVAAGQRCAVWEPYALNFRAAPQPAFGPIIPGAPGDVSGAFEEKWECND